MPNSPSKNTKPELLLRRALWLAGLRYRLHVRTPHGRPDVVFPGARVAVFIDGCFWHGCPEHYVRPRSNNAFWAQKLLQNFERDHRQTVALEQDGWTVVRVWEHEVHEQLASVVERVRAGLTEGSGTLEPSMHVVEVEVLDETGNLERRVQRNVRNPEQTDVVVRHRTTRKWAKAP
ncbi:very short patch repair endonuclease [Deinococcus hopiensis]|uniref:T/G mismatch-specific endonuclease n=1 Tax=Deinococcus hopiensis KR-140 TaxID=695939 RepID=A0A1W1ULZ8_9DEIO|nr:very short patch repair endonuclease [Deinococcus hopiensis]SMB82158.1 T/G mismatch-specific endonuclease [Deinococcus hopiensis KR-140]